MRSMAAWKAYIRRVCAGMIALALVCVCAFALCSAALAETDGMLRVKLTRLGAPGELSVQLDCDYYLASDPSVRLSSGDTVTISADSGGMTLADGERRVALGQTARLMRTQSGNRGLCFLQPELSNRFCGDLGLSASDGVITAVLNIYVENYLYGVVGYAMPPSSGLEALKAQAIAARTYAMRRKASRSDAAYDLTDASTDQVFKGYSGTSDYANVVRAVDDTRGCVMYSGSSLAQCFTCSSNGGQTESAKNAWGTALDYTVVKDDVYDFESAAQVKTAVVSKDLSNLKPELKDALADGLKAALTERGLSADDADVRVTGLESVTACDSRFAAPSRLYKSLTFKLTVVGRTTDGFQGQGSVSVSVPTYGGLEDWYDLSLNDADNETIWVRETESAFEISFRRSGSGVGMSQRGAQMMAQQGKRASEILAFYYPRLEARKLELADTTRDNSDNAPADRQKPIATARLAAKTDLLSAPEDGAAPSATVAAGATADIYGVQDDWAAVGAGGKYGYVRTEALEGFALAGTTVVRAEEPVLGRMTREADVMALPVATAAVAGQAGRDSEVQVYAWTDEWAMLRTALGVKGFVPVDAVSFTPAEYDTAADSLDPDAFVDTEGHPEAQIKQDTLLFDVPGELAQAVATLKAGDVVRVMACSREWAEVDAGSATGYVLLEDLEARSNSDIDGGPITKVEDRQYLYVKAGLVSMYKHWSEDSQPLAVLCYGERLRVGAYNAQWACVKLGRLKGYVKLDALSDTQPTPAEGGAFTYAKSDSYALTVRDVELLSLPLSGGQIVGRVDQGQRLRVGAYNERWALVYTDDGAGYVPLDALTKKQ